jgi:hypothetical protein
MRKGLFNAGIALSWILLLVVAAMWIRGDSAVLVMRPFGHILTQTEGRFNYDRIQFADWTSPEAHMPWYLRFVAENAASGVVDAEPGLFGICFWRGEIQTAWAPNNWSPSPVVLNVVHIGVPRRLALVGTMVLPVMGLTRLVTRKVKRLGRRAKGKCVDCGYDLRGLHGACPECGSVYASAESSAA